MLVLVRLENFSHFYPKKQFWIIPLNNVAQPLPGRMYTGPVEKHGPFLPSELTASRETVGNH